MSTKKTTAKKATKKKGLVKARDAAKATKKPKLEPGAGTLKRAKGWKDIDGVPKSEKMSKGEVARVLKKAGAKVRAEDSRPPPRHELLAVGASDDIAQEMANYRDGGGDVVDASPVSKKLNVDIRPNLVHPSESPDDVVEESPLTLDDLPPDEPTTPVNRIVLCDDSYVSAWVACYQGDAVSIAQQFPDSSIDYNLHSPPFSSLYTYSDSSLDMGNSVSDEQFFEHYGYLVKEIARVLRPGRLCSVHCKQLVDYAGRDGRAGLRDFRGDIIRLFESHGLKFHSEVTIFKSPVTEMQRTKAHGLLYKQLRADSSFSRQGLAEYIVTFRRWAVEGEEIRPIVHTKEDFTLDEWQNIASPVWMDIVQTNVLNVKKAREDEDEKHLCPLQLDVIERCIRLWSNPGDIVWSPFMGIGSEGHVALQVRDATGKVRPRRFVGTELKESYFKDALANLKTFEPGASGKQLGLFDT